MSERMTPTNGCAQLVPGRLLAQRRQLSASEETTISAAKLLRLLREREPYPMTPVFCSVPHDACTPQRQARGTA